eukprot:scaffold121329_cov23-Tisochrysis_lutea.AAC.1
MSACKVSAMPGALPKAFYGCTAMLTHTYTHRYTRTRTHAHMLLANPFLHSLPRSYTCLTTGDVFPVNYNNKIFEFEVMETRPGAAISVVETDCE